MVAGDTQGTQICVYVCAATVAVSDPPLWDGWCRLVFQ